MLKEINTYDDYQAEISNNDAVLFYFSHQECNVCKVLKPKIHKLIQERFPKIKLCYVDTVKTPDISGQNGVFAVPTIKIYFDRREFYTASRNISIGDLENKISRTYDMFLGD